MERLLRQKLPEGRFLVTRERSRLMASVKSRGNKSTEARLRAALVAAGISGWEIGPPHVCGKPDFFFLKEQIAVFVDGCFWHGCRKCGHIPSKNRRFWRTKILGNRRRDRATDFKLRAVSVEVIRFWEHQLRADLKGCVSRIVSLLRRVRNCRVGESVTGR